jgi:hypothetical protein
MEPIEDTKAEEIQPKPVEKEDKTLEERVSVLEGKVAILEPKVTGVEDAVKPIRQTLQVVIEKEGDITKVRRKVLITVAGNSKEQWEDVTDEVDQEVKEDLLNGT